MTTSVLQHHQLHKLEISLRQKSIEQINQFTNPMGIAFSRDTMIRTCGVKNVIYGDKAEELALKRIGLDWRYEPLDVDAYDVE